MVEGEQLDAAVDGLGGDFGVAEAAWRERSARGGRGARGRGGRTGDDVGEGAEGGFYLRHLVGVLCDKVIVEMEPARGGGWWAFRGAP